MARAKTKSLNPRPTSSAPKATRSASRSNPSAAPRTRAELPIASFGSARLWERWLAVHHQKSPGVWLRIQKKQPMRTALTYAEALDAALCFGWIDGQKKRGDAESWLQKFTPRGPKSAWSKKNTEHIRRLTRAGRMKPAGQSAVDSAKKDGRWQRAYDSPSNAEIPADFLAALDRDPKAREFFDQLNKVNRYAIAYRLQTAKKHETRERRMQLILAMMSQRKKFHP